MHCIPNRGCNLKQLPCLAFLVEFVLYDDFIVITSSFESRIYFITNSVICFSDTMKVLAQYRVSHFLHRFFYFYFC